MQAAQIDQLDRASFGSPLTRFDIIKSTSMMFVAPSNKPEEELL